MARPRGPCVVYVCCVRVRVRVLCVPRRPKVWRSVCLEVLSEKNEKRDAQDYVLDLQAVCDPTFAQWAQVSPLALHANTRTRTRSCVCVWWWWWCVCGGGHRARYGDQDEPPLTPPLSEG